MKESEDFSEAADQIFSQQKDNPDFRRLYVSWIVQYCKNKEPKWGATRLSEALIKNANPNHAEDEIFIKDQAAPLLNTLGSLLNRKGKNQQSVITLEKNGHLLRLIFLYIFRVDYDFLKKINYKIRLKNIAQSFLAITEKNSRELTKSYENPYKGGVYKCAANNNIFIEIKYWNDGYYQLFHIEKNNGNDSLKYITSPGVLIRHSPSLLGFIYFEISKSFRIYNFLMHERQSSIDVFEHGNLCDNEIVFKEVVDPEIEEFIDIKNATKSEGDKGEMAKVGKYLGQNSIEKNGSLLINNVINNNLDAIKLVLKEEPKCINYKDFEFGRTAAMYAVLMGRIKILEFLSKQRGFYADSIDWSGNDILTYTFWTGDFEFARKVYQIMYPVDDDNLTESD